MISASTDIFALRAWAHSAIDEAPAASQRNDYRSGGTKRRATRSEVLLRDVQDGLAAALVMPLDRTVEQGPESTP